MPPSPGEKFQLRRVTYSELSEVKRALLGIRKDCSTGNENKGEITLAIFADYSKAFNTVDPEVLINKIFKLNFSKPFLHWLVSYLTDREQYDQINDKLSSKVTIQFGVPQGSILGPILFNLYVADMHQNVHSEEECLQYADDSTLYHHCKVDELEVAKLDLEESLSTLSDWSSHINLVFNHTKTKMMVFTTRQMARYHGLDQEHRIEIGVNGKKIERVAQCKVLGMLFQQNLMWNNQITELLSSCYGSISVLKKIKRFTPYHIRKQLAEALILSKLDYCNVLYHGMPEYLIRRLQRVENTAAGFVQRRYANTEKTLELNWLPVKERIEFNIAKLAFKAIYFENWRSYLQGQCKTASQSIT
ncbi:Hypothetical predicted protein [Paramuricea clavata]|uniref:Uncharacterized protein n=1 Tax=Paramuricea clavata TaxID=317549 RepID=A0A6S7GR99_PARCT|nr:Hypothetical predicted protein [Paramuricea clavata]